VDLTEEDLDNGGSEKGLVWVKRIEKEKVEEWREQR